MPPIGAQSHVPARDNRPEFPVAGQTRNCENSGLQITEAHMHTETENGKRKRARTGRAAVPARGAAPRLFACHLRKKQAPRPLAAERASLDACWQGDQRQGGGARGGSLAVGERLTRQVSFGRLRASKQFRKELVARNAGDPLYLDGTSRGDTPTLPTKYGRLVDRRVEHEPELLKAHPFVLFTVSGDFGFMAHVHLSCISCNFTQAGRLHFNLTNSLYTCDRVAS